MRTLLIAPLAAIALLAAAPNPSPAPQYLDVVCRNTPLYVFQSGSDRPMRAPTPDATMGQRFGYVSGPRTTLTGFEFYETNIVVVEPGYGPNAHYWISRDCAIPSR